MNLTWNSPTVNSACGRCFASSLSAFKFSSYCHTHVTPSIYQPLSYYCYYYQHHHHSQFLVYWWIFLELIHSRLMQVQPSNKKYWHCWSGMFYWSYRLRLPVIQLTKANSFSKVTLGKAKSMRENFWILTQAGCHYCQSSNRIKALKKTHHPFTPKTKSFMHINLNVIQSYSFQNST